MKLDDILATNTEQQLDEVSIKQGLAAGLLSGMLALHNMPPQQTAPEYRAPTITANQIQPKQQAPKQREIKPEYMPFVKEIVDTYKVPVDLAAEVVELAHKYQDPVFPKARDIIAVIGVESSFNPNAVSKLKEDPAIGLMQVRPGKWGLTPGDLSTVEDQIKHGSSILKKYFVKLKGNKKAALQAYNVGLTNYKKGVKAPRYVKKFDIEHQRFAINTQPTRA